MKIAHCGLTDCDAVWTYGWLPLFLWNILPLSTELKSVRRVKWVFSF